MTYEQIIIKRMGTLLILMGHFNHIKRPLTDAEYYERRDYAEEYDRMKLLLRVVHNIPR